MWSFFTWTSVCFGSTSYAASIARNHPSKSEISGPASMDGVCFHLRMISFEIPMHLLKLISVRWFSRMPIASFFVFFLPWVPWGTHGRKTLVPRFSLKPFLNRVLRRLVYCFQPWGFYYCEVQVMTHGLTSETMHFFLEKPVEWSGVESICNY